MKKCEAVYGTVYLAKASIMYNGILTLETLEEPVVLLEIYVKVGEGVRRRKYDLSKPRHMSLSLGLIAVVVVQYSIER